MSAIAIDGSARDDWLSRSSRKSHPFSLHRRTSTDRHPDRKQASNLDARQTLGLAHHFETSLQIPSSLNLRGELSKVHSILATLYLEEDKFNDAYTHVEHAGLHAGNDMLQLGRVCFARAYMWCKENGFGKAKPNTLRTLDVCGKPGVVNLSEKTRQIPEKIKEMN